MLCLCLCVFVCVFVCVCLRVCLCVVCCALSTAKASDIRRMVLSGSNDSTKYPAAISIYPWPNSFYTIAVYVEACMKASTGSCIFGACIL